MDSYTLTLLGLALAPGVAIMLYIYERDKIKKEPPASLAICFVLGMVATVPAILLESIGGYITEFLNTGFLTQQAIQAFVVVALSEEGSKYFFLKRYAYRLKSFDEPFDGIVYAVFIGMGFATLENVLYVMNGDMSTAMWRMFTAVPAHGTFAVIMGHYSGLAKLRSPQTAYLSLGLGLAVLFHGAYDYFLFISNRNLLFVGAWISLLFALWLSFRAIRLHRSYMDKALANSNDLV